MEGSGGGGSARLETSKNPVEPSATSLLEVEIECVEHVEPLAFDPLLSYQLKEFNHG